VGQRDQLRAAGDQGGVDVELLGALVAAVLEAVQAPFIALVEALALAAEGPRGMALRQAAGYRIVHAFAAARGEKAGDGVIHLPAGRRSFGDVDHGVRGEDEEGGAVGGHGLLLAPVPEFAEDGKGVAVQAVAALDAPDLIGVGGPEHRAVVEQLDAHLPVPLEAAFGGEFGGQEVGERLEMPGVVARVILHPGREGAPGPVGLLRALLQLYPEKPLHQAAQPELAHAQDPGGQHGVEDGRGRKPMVLAHQPQVVVRPMQDQLVPGENLKNRLQPDAGQGIDQLVSPRNAHLNQAELFRVGMQAVRLRINGNPGGGDELGQESVQFLVRINHALKYMDTDRQSSKMKSGGNEGLVGSRKPAAVPSPMTGEEWGQQALAQVHRSGHSLAQFPGEAAGEVGGGEFEADVHVRLVGGELGGAEEGQQVRVAVLVHLAEQD
jgi:hypothetical protein